MTDGSDWRPGAGLERLRLVASLRAGIREWMAAEDVLEVVTPVLSRGAPPDLHLDSFRTATTAARGSSPAEPPTEADTGTPGDRSSSPANLADDGTRWLQTSPEYPMKRLLAAYGVDVHQMAPVFRAGERGARHNPEFTMLEWYRVGLDHVALMADVAALFESLWARFGKPWHSPERRALHDVVDGVLGPGAAAVASRSREGAASGGSRRRTTDSGGGSERPESGRAATDAPFVEVGRVRAHFLAEGRSWPESIGDDADAALELLLDEFVLPALPADRVTFLHGWPPSQAALARVGGDARGRAVAERFEVYVGALELGNGYHELADAAEQRARFERELGRRRALGRETPPLDEGLLGALAAGLPDCAGVAVGLERLAMVLGDVARIDDVLAFPFERA